MFEPRPGRRWRPGDSLVPIAEILAQGGILAIPTESSYGLAADPRRAEGVEAIYEVKQRTRGKPLPVVVADIAQAVALGVPEDLPELELLADLWPAPLTAVLPITEPLAATAGSATLAVRVPAHDGLRQLLADLGFGLTATSANPSGEPPIVAPDALAAFLVGHRALLFDDGTLAGGPPSTLVTWRAGQLQILRRGAFPVSRLPASAVKNVP